MFPELSPYPLRNPSLLLVSAILPLLFLPWTRGRNTFLPPHGSRVGRGRHNTLIFPLPSGTRRTHGIQRARMFPFPLLFACKTYTIKLQKNELWVYDSHVSTARHSGGHPTQVTGFVHFVTI